MHPIHSHYANAFLSPPASEEASGTAPSGLEAALAPGVPVYCPASHGCVAEFALSDGFKAFRESIQRDIGTLIDVAGGMPITVSALEEWREKLFDVDIHGRHLGYGEAEAALMYRHGADLLRRLVQLIREERLPLSSRQLELQRLGQQLQVCAPAVLSELAGCIGRLDPERSGIAGKFRSVVEQIIEHVAIEAVEIAYGEDFTEARLAQAHFVNGLKKRLYEALELPWPLQEDVFAHHRHDQALVQQCVQTLRPALAPGSVARIVADDYLQRFTDAMRKLAARHGPMPHPTLDQLKDCTEPLDTEFGAPPPLEALLVTRNEGKDYECATDSTRVALHFLDAMRTANLLVSDPGADIEAASGRPLDGDTGLQEPGRGPVGQLRWTSEAGGGVVRHELAESQIRELLDQRVRGEPLPRSLQIQLSDLLTAVTAVTKSSARGRLASHSETSRSMSVTQPLRLWWRVTGEALRADPPRLEPQELLDVLTCPGSTAVPPLIECLRTAHEDIVHILFAGLTELQRDGLLSAEALFKALDPHAPAVSGGWPAALAACSPHGLKALLTFAVKAAADGNLASDRCRELLLGPDTPLAPVSTSPGGVRRTSLAVPLAWLAGPLTDDARCSRLSARLNAYFDVLSEASSRQLIAKEDLLRVLDGLDPLAATWEADGAAGRNFDAGLSKWFSRVVRLCLNGQLSVEETAAALRFPAHWPETRRVAFASTLIGAVGPVLQLGTGRREPENESRLRRQLLDSVMGLDVQAPCRLIRELRDADHARAARDCAFHLTRVMGMLGYTGEQIALATQGP